MNICVSITSLNIYKIQTCDEVSMKTHLEKIYFPNCVSQGVQRFREFTHIRAIRDLLI